MLRVPILFLVLSRLPAAVLVEAPLVAHRIPQVVVQAVAGQEIIVTLATVHQDKEITAEQVLVLLVAVAVEVLVVLVGLLILPAPMMAAMVVLELYPLLQARQFNMQVVAVEVRQRLMQEVV
jgi:hypothetical protein